MDNPHHFWEERYASEAYVYGTRPNRYFQEQLDGIGAPGRLLLLAEGEGRNAVYAAQKGWQVTAVDFSEQGKAKALALAARHGVEITYHIADVLKYDLVRNGPWDAIGLIYAHFKPELRRFVHRDCVAGLRTGGHILLEAFHPRQLGLSSGGPKDADMLYSQKILEEDFQGCEWLEAAETTDMLDEGPGHRGLAELVRFHVKKS